MYDRSTTRITMKGQGIMNTVCTICKGPSDSGLMCPSCATDEVIENMHKPQPTKPMNIENTLNERGERYGQFEHHAVIAQDLQDVLRKQTGWTNLAADQKQALTVICDKIARMLNGDPTYRDNWHDIVGYAKLVDDRMLRDEQQKDKP